MVKLGNPKNALWEALLITIVIFTLGLLFGIGYENNKVNQINEYYLNSEVSLMDSFSLSNIMDLNISDCSSLINNQMTFADKIYSESQILDNLESAGKITDNLQEIHTKYDALRTFLWISTIKTYNQCKGNFSVIVYLYNYNTNDLVEKAEQATWSRVLSDLKEAYGSKVILIPIAADSNLASLNSLVDNFNITSYPAVIINQKHVITKIPSVGDLEKYLN